MMTLQKMQRLAHGEVNVTPTQSDPGEMYNRSKENPDIVKRIWTEMQQLAKETGARLPEGDKGH